MRLGATWLTQAIEQEIHRATALISRRVQVELWLRARITDADWQTLKRTADRYDVTIEVIA